MTDADQIAALAKRIPFRMTRHMSGTKFNSGRYTCQELGIGHEYHYPARNGYILTGPNVKVVKHFYREEPKDSPTYPTLRELLANDPELRQRAEAKFPEIADGSDGPDGSDGSGKTEH